MATYQANPVLPAAGKSLSAFPSLPFQARAVQISSGSYWVQVGTDGFTVPPGASGVVHVLPQASAVQPITLTAPPASLSPVGPANITNPLIVFTNDPNASENPGTLATPQTVATFSTTITSATPLTIDTGLARALTIQVFNQGGQATLSVNREINGNLEPWGSFTLATNANVDLAFGQGTIGNQSLTNQPQTLHLNDSIQLTTVGGVFLCSLRLIY